MEFNRLVSLVVGFIVLILLFVWISSRFRANTNTANKAGVTPTVTTTPTITPTKKPGSWNPFGFLSRNTPTPTRKPTVTTPTPVKIVVENKKQQKNIQNQGQTTTDVTYTNYKTGKKIVVNEIPETGAPTAVLALAVVALTSGMYLRRSS